MKKIVYLCRCKFSADVAKLVDALDLGSSSERSVGSSPFIRTMLYKAGIFIPALFQICL